ncbi:MAG: uroporphyrinogen decarboxylase family protein, partial [Pirellulales bacterium]
QSQRAELHRRQAKAQADPFATAALAHGSGAGAPRPRGPSLFERVTGANRSRKPGPEEAPQPVAKTIQPKLGGLDQAARIAAAAVPDAILDIPIVLPPLVVGLSLLILFHQVDVFGRPIEDWFSAAFAWLKLIDLRGYENALFDFEDREPKVFELLEMLENFNLHLVKNYVTHGRAEWIGFAEDLGMQHGPMLSPRQFREFIRPSYQRMMQSARDAGCVVHVHADGDLRALMPDLLDCPIDVINLQDLVNGIDWLAEQLTGKICVDLDIDRQSITALGTPTEIDALIRTEVERLGSPQGGLMLIYGLYPGVPLRNVKAVMDAMERYATYYS